MHRVDVDKTFSKVEVCFLPYHGYYGYLTFVLLVFWRWLVRRDMTRVNRLLLVTNEPLDGEGWLVEEVEECIWWLS